MTKNAFTLVELIVTISILSVLGTIAFISFLDYSSGAKDSVRVSEIGSLRYTLNVFEAEKGYFPDPDGGVKITYGGSEIWTQGVYGDTTTSIINALDKTPTDPMTGKNYTYSRTNKKNEFELGTINEKAILYSPLITDTHAKGDRQAFAYIRGNYNGKILSVSTGGTTFVFAIPSIIVTDLDNPTIESTLFNKSFTYNNFPNLPHSYGNTKYSVHGGFDFPKYGDDILIYTGTTNTFITDLKNNQQSRLSLVKNTQSVYSGSLLDVSGGKYDELINTEIDLTNPTDKAKTLACKLVNIGFSTKLSASDCE